MKMRIAKSDLTPTEILMSALEQVDSAEGVVIIIQKEDSISVKSSYEHKDLKWTLDQVQYLVMADEFGHLDREPSI